MRILVMSCTAGEGHNAAAKALVEQVRALGHDCRFLDTLSLRSRLQSEAVGNFYAAMVKYTPMLFKATYDVTDVTSRSDRHSPVYHAVGRYLYTPMLNYLAEFEPDVIIATHIFAGELLTYLKNNGRLKVPFIEISTDYTSTPMWEETRPNVLTIAHQDVAGEYLAKGIHPERLKALGIPVSVKFEERLPQKEARKKMGLEEEGVYYLVMGGSMGFGKIINIAGYFSAFYHMKEHMVIVCGHNDRILEELTRRFGLNPNLSITGFTTHISELMDACDVVVTKPGGLTSTEAAVKKIPIVHMPPIPGCETKNFRFFRSHGMSVSGRNEREIVEACQNLARDKAFAEKLMKAQAETIPPHSAREIVKLAVSLAEANQRKLDD